MNQPLSQKVVIVTGASSGVGEAAAEAFARAGARVVLAARSADKIERLARKIGGLAIPADVSRFDDLRMLIERTVEAYGRIDVLVNNAAAKALGTFDTLDADAIAAVIDTNLKGPMLLTRLALPHLRKTKGVVVNVASLAGHVPLPGESAYTASKWGLRGFTFAVNEEMRGTGVSLCAVSPGPIMTPFILDDLDTMPAAILSQPFLSAAQVAEAVVACAMDRKRERALPRSALFFARLAYRMSWLQNMFQPMLEKKGEKVRVALRASR